MTSDVSLNNNRTIIPQGPSQIGEDASLDEVASGKVSVGEKANVAVKSMSSLGKIDPSKATDSIDGADIPPDEGGEGGDAVVPPSPPLPKPPKISSPVDLTILLNALQLNESKKNAERTASEIKAQAKDREISANKELDQLQQKAEQLEKSKTLGVFGKIFQAIGAVLGAIASVASIAAGVATGNPLLIAGGVMGLTMAVDSVVSLASDGKYSITAGLTKAFEAMGMSSEAAQWLAVGLQMVMVVASMGAGFASGGAKGVELASKVVPALMKSTQAVNVAESVVQAGTSGLTIGKGVVDSDVKRTESKILDQEKIQTAITKNMDLLQNFFQNTLEKVNSLTESVDEIVKDHLKTMAAIQRGVAS